MESGLEEAERAIMCVYDPTCSPDVKQQATSYCEQVLESVLQGSDCGWHVLSSLLFDSHERGCLSAHPPSVHSRCFDGLSVYIQEEFIPI